MDTALRTAIYTYLLTHAIFDADNTFYLEAPQDTDEDPLLIFFEAANPSNRDTAKQYDTYHIQFSIYSKVLTIAEGAQDAINALFDYKQVAFTTLLSSAGYEFNGIFREYRQTTKDDKNYWHAINRYNLQVRKV